MPERRKLTIEIEVDEPAAMDLWEALDRFLFASALASAWRLKAWEDLKRSYPEGPCPECKVPRSGIVEHRCPEWHTKRKEAPNAAQT